jgi:ATP-dependent DNA helicase RecG
VSAAVPREESSAARAVFERMSIAESWQIALLLPSSYDDITRPVASARDLSETTPLPLTFRVAGPVSTSGSGGVPRATLTITDARGENFRATIFGNAKEWAKRLVPGQHYTFLATGKTFAQQWNVTLKELVEPEYVGSVRPTYPLRRSKQTPSLIRSIVRAHLPSAVPHAARFVAEQLAPIAPIAQILADIGCPGWTLVDLITQAHAPQSLDYAQHARGAYLKLAALGALARLHLAAPVPAATPVHLHTLAARIAALPVTLTADQHDAVHAFARLLEKPQAMRAVCTGEVGSGKTLMASVLIAGFLDATDARVLVMVPNAQLAAQFRREFSQAFPDQASVLVTGESDADDDVARARLVFGTSAVLFRDMGRFALVIVDEQQKWGRHQREHYMRSDTHLLEMSATCIPRTQALVKYGRVEVVQMKSCHAPKNIRTRLWQGPQQVAHLMAGLRRVIERGSPVIVVYPKREVTGAGEDTQGAIDDRYSIEAAVPRWEKHFPGRVRAVTSDHDTPSKLAAIADLEQGRASVLLATSTIETGLNIQGLRNIVIAHPDRHGITTLHQFRGRVARQGGDGFCELLVLEPISEKARVRLEAFMSTTDGFRLAELDLELRGTGDMGAQSETQSGADQTFLYGVPLTVEAIEQVRDLWAGYLQARA